MTPLVTFAFAFIASTCTPYNTLDDRKADACAITGGKPYVQDFLFCTTERGSCRDGRIYKGCTR